MMERGCRCIITLGEGRLMTRAADNAVAALRNGTPYPDGLLIAGAPRQGWRSGIAMQVRVVGKHRRWNGFMQQVTRALRSCGRSSPGPLDGRCRDAPARCREICQGGKATAAHGEPGGRCLAEHAGR